MNCQTFSTFLHRELDAVGYPGSRERCPSLARHLGLSRTQAYRLLSGLASPTLDSLRKLRRLGISVDRLLDEGALQDGDPIDTIELVPGIRLAGKCIPATSETGVVVRHSARGSKQVRFLSPGEPPLDSEVFISSLHFAQRPSVAVVHHDPNCRRLLSDCLADTFRVAVFESARALCDHEHGVDSFRAIVIGSLLLATGKGVAGMLRELTSAPIFVLDKDCPIAAEPAIHRARRRTYLVPYPIDPALLVKRIKAELKKSHLAEIRFPVQPSIVSSEEKVRPGSARS